MSSRLFFELSPHFFPSGKMEPLMGGKSLKELEEILEISEEITEIPKLVDQEDMVCEYYDRRSNVEEVD